MTMKEKITQIADINRNNRVFSGMLAASPGFWYFCGFIPVDAESIHGDWKSPDSGKTVQASRLPELCEKRISITGMLRFDSVEDWQDDLKFRKKESREELIRRRPFATVINMSEQFGYDLRKTGVILPGSSIRVVFERNVTSDFDVVDPKKILGSGMVPETEQIVLWENVNSVMMRDLLTITKNNSVPDYKTEGQSVPHRFGLSRLNIIHAGFEIPPQYCGVKTAQSEGLHFVSSHIYQYG